jgi:hypothetical protein
VLLPRRSQEGELARGADARTPANIFSYEIPNGLIEQKVPGAITTQIRARLIDGSALPAGIEFDSFSRTFEIRSEGKISLPLDVLLLVPTRSGVTVQLPITIGKP